MSRGGGTRDQLAASSLRHQPTPCLPRKPALPLNWSHRTGLTSRPSSPTILQYSRREPPRLCFRLRLRLAGGRQTGTSEYLAAWFTSLTPLVLAVLAVHRSSTAHHSTTASSR